jgi:hypothetical protein
MDSDEQVMEVKLLFISPRGKCPVICSAWSHSMQLGEMSRPWSSKPASVSSQLQGVILHPCAPSTK